MNLCRLLTIFAMVLTAVEMAASEKPPFPRTWVFAKVDFYTNQRVDEFLDLMRRAKEAGYNGFVLHDARMPRPPDEHPPRYWQNLERVRDESDKLRLEIIPSFAPLAFSNGVLGNDPNLAEGVPVKDCLFRVAEGRATVAEPENCLPSGDCERFYPASRPIGWEFVDGPGKSLFADREVKHSGESSVRMERFRDGSKFGLCRMLKKLKLKPWHEYYVGAWIRTEKVARPDTIRIVLHGDVESPKRFDLNRRPLNVAATQDWKLHEFVFNTFDNDEVWFYIGTWGAESGTIWIDDVSLREVGGINLLRREGCPIAVTSNDGSTTYEEGGDFERWEYADMGRIPYPGIYRVHPEPPIVLTPDSRIGEGETLRVSFYHAQEVMNGSYVTCLRHERVFELYKQQIQRIRTVFPNTKTYFLKHAELRLAGWCGLCDDPDVTAGQILAEHVRHVANLVREIQPDAELVVWSDMYDPNHNAVDRYWHTRGSMAESWNGLDQRFIIANWNQGQRDESLKWFAGRGHRQVIATYYDRSNWETVLTDWLDAAEGIEGVEGLMYTTWGNDYRHLEDFLELARRHIAR